MFSEVMWVGTIYDKNTSSDTVQARTKGPYNQRQDKTNAKPLVSKKEFNKNDKQTYWT